MAFNLFGWRSPILDQRQEAFLRRRSAAVQQIRPVGGPRRSPFGLRTPTLAGAPAGPQPMGLPEHQLTAIARGFAPETVPLRATQEAAFAGAEQPFERARLRAGGLGARRFQQAIQGAAPEQLGFLRGLSQQLQRRGISAKDFTRVATLILTNTTQPSSEAEAGRFFTAEEAQLRGVVGDIIVELARDFPQGLERFAGLPIPSEPRVDPATLPVGSRPGGPSLPESPTRPIGEAIAGLGRFGVDVTRGALTGEPITETVRETAAVRGITEGETGLESLVTTGQEVPFEAGALLDPINFVPLPIVDPLVVAGLGRIATGLGITLKAGVRVSRPLLARLGREAAEQATSETLDGATRIALREFSEEVERAAVLTPGEAAEVGAITGLPSRADVVAPTAAPVAPARAVPEAEARPSIGQATFEGRGSELPVRPLPPRTDNFLKDLDFYTDRIYREVNGDNVIFELPGSRANREPGQLFFANTRNFARAQGRGGYILEFDPKNPGGVRPIQGQVNTAKPGLDVAYEAGEAEFVVRHASGEQLKESVRSVTVLPDAEISAGRGTRLRNYFDQQGWQRVDNPDGTVTFTRPVEAPAPARPVEPGAAPAVRQAAPAPPTVKTRTLFGEEVDTFATERELGGIREAQAGLPLEERPPARDLPDLFGRTERDIAEELRIADEDLALSRLPKGARAEFQQQRFKLIEEQRILRLVRESPDTDVLLEGLERELEDVSFDLSRKGVPFGGRAGLSVRQAAKQRIRGRGTTIARTSLETPQLQARAAALEDWIPRLREQARPFPPSADELVPVGVRDADAPPVPRPMVLGGASETFAGPLRDFDQVVGGVVTSDNPLVRALVGRTGINPSVLRDTPLGRTTVAYWRQRIAADELVDLAVQAAIDTHAQRGTGFARTFRLTEAGVVRNLDAPQGASRIWNDVFSTPDRYRLTSDQRAFIEDFRRVVEEAEFLRVQAGLEPRPTSGVNATTEGWFYVPRQVKGVRGVELRRPSSPRLQRQYEEAAQGVAHGVNYDNPRNTLRLHLRAAYQEIIEKQLSDHLETLQAQALKRGERTFVTPKELVREPVMRRMSDATLRRLSAERAVRRERAAIFKQRQEAARGITEGRVGVERARTRLAGTQDVAKAKGRLGELEAVRTDLQVQREAAKRLPRISSRDVTEAVSPAATTELEAARREFALAKGQYQKALEAARRSEIAPGTLFGRTEDTIAIGQWRNRFFPVEDAKALREGIEEFFKPAGGSPFSPTQFVLRLANVKRMLASTFDFAEPFIQGQTVFAIDPARWARAAKLHYQAFLDPTVQARFIRENMAAFQEMAAHGTPIGDAEFFVALRPGEGFSLGQLLELLPKGQEARQLLQAGGRQSFGRFQASYNTGLGASRALLTDALKGAIPDAAARQAFIRNATGGLDSRALGVAPGQRAVEGFALGFSPRFLRSTIALVGDLRLGLTNPRGRAAFASLTKLATAVTGLYVLSGLALGKSWEEIGTGLNPMQGKKFLAHEINGDWIGIGGQVRALVQLGAHMWVNRDNPGAFFELNLDNPLWRFWMFRGAPAIDIVGGAIEATTGADVLPFDEVDGPIDYVKHLGTSSLPFALQGRLEGEQPLTTVFGEAGFRTRAETRFEKLQRGFEEKFGRPFNRETDFAVARQDPDLAPLVGRSEQAAQRDELLAQEEQRLLPVAQAVLAGNEEAGAQFRRERSDFLTFAAGAAAQAFYGTQFPDPETEDGRILAEFYDLAPEDFRDPETLAPDFAQFDAAREQLLTQLPQDLQRAIKERTRFAHPDLQEADKRYRVARDLLDQAPSRVSGLTSEQHRMITDFMQTVREARRTWLGQRGITYEDLPLEEAVAIVGQFQGRDPAFMRWAQALRSGVSDDLRSAEYDRFLIEHEDSLRLFYPDFYRSQRILGQLFETKQPVAIGR